MYADEYFQYSYLHNKITNVKQPLVQLVVNNMFFAPISIGVVFAFGVIWDKRLIPTSIAVITVCVRNQLPVSGEMKIDHITFAKVFANLI